MATQNVPEQAGLAPVEPEPETGETGGCPIWQVPFVSAGYGATIGFLALW